MNQIITYYWFLTDGSGWGKRSLAYAVIIRVLSQVITMDTHKHPAEAAAHHQPTSNRGQTVDKSLALQPETTSCLGIHPIIRRSSLENSATAFGRVLRNSYLRFGSA
ncbi:MAG TPA: hypothetical protein VGK59_05530 [Ohtaekwangia sp.]